MVSAGAAPFRASCATPRVALSEGLQPRVNRGRRVGCKPKLCGTYLTLAILRVFLNVLFGAMASLLGATIHSRGVVSSTLCVVKCLLDAARYSRHVSSDGIDRWPTHIAQSCLKLKQAGGASRRRGSCHEAYRYLVKLSRAATHHQRAKHGQVRTTDMAGKLRGAFAAQPRPPWRSRHSEPARPAGHAAAPRQLHRLVGRHLPHACESSCTSARVVVGDVIAARATTQLSGVASRTYAW